MEHTGIQRKIRNTSDRKRNIKTEVQKGIEVREKENQGEIEGEER